MELQNTLKSPERNTTLDIFRAFAILGVVLYHFNFTIYHGTLGVDLFFVISGFLVGGLLIKDFQREKKIVFTEFFMRRGFKIWPSYYFYLLIGGILAYIMYHKTNPGLLPSNWWRYIFFIRISMRQVFREWTNGCSVRHGRYVWKNISISYCH